MIRLLVITFFLFPSISFAQELINKSKAEVKKELQHYITKNDTLRIRMTETDSLIHVSILASPTLPAEFLYTFNRSGKCIMQETKAFCDSCLQKYLGVALNQKKYGWRKINENQYVSKYSKRLLLETPPENKEYSFRILQTQWTKKMYSDLF